MPLPWTILAGWRGRTVNATRTRFTVADVDPPHRRILVKNSQGSEVWLYERDLDPVYDHAARHGAVRPTDVYRILDNRGYRSATYAAALVNALLGLAA
jgi:hypothetical protein